MASPKRCICGSLPILEEKKRLGANSGLTFFRVACDKCSNGLEARRASAKTIALDELVKRWNDAVDRAKEKNPLGVHLIEGGKRCICSACELLYRGYDTGRAEIRDFVGQRPASEDIGDTYHAICDRVGKPA